MIRPTKLGKKKDDMSFDDVSHEWRWSILTIQLVYLQEDDEDVVISLCSKDPQACKGVVRFDYTKGEYVPVKLTEWMIDHLEVESAVLHKESEEAKIQLQREGANKLGNYFLAYPSHRDIPPWDQQLRYSDLKHYRNATTEKDHC